MAFWNGAELIFWKQKCLGKVTGRQVALSAEVRGAGEARLEPLCLTGEPPGLCPPCPRNRDGPPAGSLKPGQRRSARRQTGARGLCGGPPASVAGESLCHREERRNFLRFFASHLGSLILIFSHLAALSPVCHTCAWLCLPTLHSCFLKTHLHRRDGARRPWAEDANGLESGLSPMVALRSGTSN